MYTGACLWAAARHWAQLGLGPGAHNSPAELAPAAPVARRSPRTRLLRRRRLHVCTWYENVCKYDMQQQSLKCPSRNTTNLPNSTSNSSNKTRNIRIHIRSIWTPKSGVSGPILGVSPGVFKNPEYPGLYPESPGLTAFSPQKLKSWFLAKPPHQIWNPLES